MPDTLTDIEELNAQAFAALIKAFNPIIRQATPNRCIQVASALEYIGQPSSRLVAGFEGAAWDMLEIRSGMAGIELMANILNWYNERGYVLKGGVVQGKKVGTE